jgi:3-phenylpropionate/cinnamic acid dioxygenase small subunit
VSSFNVADRFEILNVISLYSLLYDDGQCDDWPLLFTEEANFIIYEAFPDGSTTTISGRKQLHQAALNASANRQRIGQERHLLTNVAVTSQTDTTSEIAAILLLVRTAPDGKTVSETPGHYAGTLVKQLDGWKIDHWCVHLDADRAGNLG